MSDASRRIGRSEETHLPAQTGHRNHESAPPEEPFRFPPLAFAGVIPSRIAAFAVDLVVAGLFVVLGWTAAIVLGIITFGAIWPEAGLTWAILIAYFVLQVGGPRSATWGMRSQGLELRTWDGQRPGYLQAALHSFLFYGTVTVLTVLILLVPFFNSRRRCLHDYLCGTVMVRAEAL